MLSRLAALLALVVALPQETPGPVAARRFAEGERPVTHVAADGKSERLFVATKEGRIGCWNVAKAKLEWSAAVPVRDELPIRALSVGSEFVYSTLGQPAVDRNATANGEQKMGSFVPVVDMTQRVLHLAADRDDRWVWAAGDTPHVMRTVPGTTQFLRRGVDNGGVTALALDASGERLAVGGRDASIRFVDAQNADVEEDEVLEGHGGPVIALAFAGKALASGSEDTTVRIWLPSGKPKHALEGHRAAVRALAADDKGKLVASGDDAGTVRVWDLDKGVELASFATDPTGAVTSLAFVEKGKTVAAAHGAKFVSLWPVPKR